MGLYAAGDVNGRGIFLHMSKYHGRVVASAIIAKQNGLVDLKQQWGRTWASADAIATPQVIFTLPAVASVGFTKRTAQAKGRKIKEYTALVKTEGAELRVDSYEDGWGSVDC